jgi:hypothetical protein
MIELKIMSINSLQPKNQSCLISDIEIVRDTVNSIYTQLNENNRQ